jgi:hypothetical protein
MLRLSVVVASALISAKCFSGGLLWWRTLHAEGSGQRNRYYKLRFRMDSKQHVRYVGNNPEFVDQVQRELTRLQSRTRSHRQLHALIQEANKCLRRTKEQLRPLLPLAGRCFHGREIRRRPGRDDV